MFSIKVEIDMDLLRYYTVPTTVIEATACLLIS